MEKLRFRDKDGNNYPNWKSTPFSETYIKAKEGGTPNTSVREYYQDGNIPFVKIDDLKNKYVYEVPSHINDIGIKNSSAWIVPIDSVLLSNGATIGETSINKIEVSTKQGILGIIPRIHNEYLYYLVSSNSFRRDLKKITTKGTMDAAYVKDIAQIRINLPVRQEQEKIGGFLSSFDKLIQKQQEMIGLLKELKKGYLQQMFPVKGANVPKIRFKGFTDAWEQCKLGDMAESIEYGLNASATEYDGINKYLRITDIDEDTRLFKTGDITSPNIDYNGSDNYLLKKGDILFARTGASVGKSYIYKENDGRVYFAGFLIRARIKSGYSPQFIYQTTLRDDYTKKIMITSQRSGQPGVNAKEYSNFEFLIPSYKEQVKIEEYFEKIDNLVTFHQHKLEKLEEMKKGYMQRLFC